MALKSENFATRDSKNFDGKEENLRHVGIIALSREICTHKEKRPSDLVVWIFILPLQGNWRK